MPRSQRVVLPGQPLHIIQRGNNRSTCFVCDDDREMYLQTLHRASLISECAIHAYVLMSNHVHMLVTPAAARAAGHMMQTLGQRYVRYFNERYARSGTLWEGRFRSMAIDSDQYFLACSRYVETNPVRAGMAASPERYRWSSFGRNARGEPNALVTPHALYLALGRDASSRQAAYAGLFAEPLERQLVDGIRKSTNAGVVLRVWREAREREFVRTRSGGVAVRHARRAEITR
ncbi:MAG: transposase [bacterium]